MITRLYFPNIETGSASTGYITIQIVDHVAEIDDSEHDPIGLADALTHWQATDGASILQDDEGGEQ